MSFTTMRFSPGTGEAEVLKVTNDPKVYSQNQHMACHRCHEKKLKCNGNKDGCARCTKHSLPCTYPIRHSRKSQTSGRHSSCSSRSGRAESNSPNSSVAFQPSRSSKHKDRRSSQSTRRPDGPALGTGSDAYGIYAGNYSTGTSESGQGAFNMNMLMATTASHTAGYHAIAPSGDYATQAGDYSDEWMLHAATTSAGMVSPYMATSDALYGHHGSAYTDYSQQSAYNGYQNDPRFSARTHQ